MTELENINKSFDLIKIQHVNNKIDQSGLASKMNEEILSVETFESDENHENVNGFIEKLTSDKMDNPISSNESFHPVSSCAKHNSNTDGLSAVEMNDKIHSSECFELVKNEEIISGLNDKQLPNHMDDEMLSNESDGEIISEMDVIENQAESELHWMKENLLDCVARSDGFFKSQQVGEPDLTFSEKREIASNLLMKSLPLFLQRYWRFIKIEDAPYFDPYTSDYEVNFYVNEIIKLNNTRTNKVRIKNRRFEALQRMVDEGSYFSDAEMKKRNPFLYDQMIGQHLTEKERMAAYKEQYPDKNFSAFLLNQMEKNVENCLFERQKDEDDAIVEEEDDDSEEEESELEDDEPVKKVVTDEEKKQLRSEFTNIMYESFLEGKDMDFDYNSVDTNVDFDSIRQRDIDEQEKYFDEESSHSAD